MAVPVILSVGIRDAANTPKSRRTIPFKLAAGTSVSAATTVLATLAANLDAAIDPVIENASVTLPIALPGGIKTDPTVGQSVNIGANLLYATAADTNWGYFIPGWKSAGFSGKSVLDSGVYATLIAALISLGITDDAGSVVSSFRRGNRGVRK